MAFMISVASLTYVVSTNTMASVIYRAWKTSTNMSWATFLVLIDYDLQSLLELKHPYSLPIF